MSSIQVLDIYADNKVNLEEEKACGIDGVIIKAGQGQYPEYFAKHSTFIDQCKALDLPWGIYWVVDARYSPESHKATIKQYFPDGDFGPLGLWLDVEKPVIAMPEFVYKKLPFAFYKPIESIAQSMISHSATGVGIYTSPGQWQLCSGNIPLVKQQFFATLPLWTAQFKTSTIDLYGAWAAAVMWQYQGEPDYSRVLDEAWWAKKVGTTPTPPPPTPAPAWAVTYQTETTMELRKQ